MGREGDPVAGEWRTAGDFARFRATLRVGKFDEGLCVAAQDHWSPWCAGPLLPNRTRAGRWSALNWRRVLPVPEVARLARTLFATRKRSQVGTRPKRECSIRYIAFMNPLCQRALRVVRCLRLVGTCHAAISRVPEGLRFHGPGRKQVIAHAGVSSNTLRLSAGASARSFMP